MGADSVWIITADSSFIDLFDASVISSMEGALGIRTYFSQDSSSDRKFEAQFRKTFQSDYPEEYISDPRNLCLKGL